MAVPVFQFGIFGEKSLGFHAGPNFDFGGRVHTNQSLYLASGDGSTLTFRDKITAFTQVVRDTLLQRQSRSRSDQPRGPCRSRRSSAALARRLPQPAGDRDQRHQGRAVHPRRLDGQPLLDGLEEPVGVDRNGYATNIRTEATGAKQLNLPLATQGAEPIDLIRRPAVTSNENIANPTVFGQRYLRAGQPAHPAVGSRRDITNLPTVTGRAGALDAGPACSPRARSEAPAAGRSAPSPGAERRGEPALADQGVGDRRRRRSVLQIVDQRRRRLGRRPPRSRTWLKWHRRSRLVATARHRGHVHRHDRDAAHRLRHPRAGQQRRRSCGTWHAPEASVPRSSTVDDDQPPTPRLRQRVQHQERHDRRPVRGDARLLRRRGSGDLHRLHRHDADRLHLERRRPRSPSTIRSTAAPRRRTTRRYCTASSRSSGRDANGAWTDVTMEILNLGFAGPTRKATLCADPTPNAVIRLQRLRDNGRGGLRARRTPGLRRRLPRRLLAAHPVRRARRVDRGCWPPTPACDWAASSPTSRSTSTTSGAGSPAQSAAPAARR